MSKLLQDEKVSALVAKEVAKAVKSERKRIIDEIKVASAEIKDSDADKTYVKGALTAFKSVIGTVKSA